MNSINPQSSNLNPDVESRPLFKLPLIVLLLMGAYAIACGIDRWADREDGDRHSSPITRHTVDLTACTPAHVKVTPVVTFTIRITADDKPVVLGCTTYAATNTIPTERVIARYHQ